jgi:hypothetical protein
MEFISTLISWILILTAAGLTIAFPLPMIGLWVMLFVLSRL